jgi:hypothetical protein
MSKPRESAADRVWKEKQLDSRVTLQEALALLVCAVVMVAAVLIV